MGFSYAEIWNSMGLLSRLVALSLVVMAVASLGVVIERLVYLARSSRQSKEFAPRASSLLAQGKLAELIDLAGKFPLSHLARLVGAGAKRFVSFDELDDGQGLSPLEAARRDMARRSDALAAELRAGLGVLASVGSVAPFVGLFGTVVGIITAFQGIAKSGSGGLGSVSAGIAEALIVTALGLVVAIPAVLLFNFLSSRIDGVELGLTNAAGEFLDGLEHSYGSADRKSGEREAA
jgi:biopolymer transport protein ExbB